MRPICPPGQTPIMRHRHGSARIVIGCQIVCKSDSRRAIACGKGFAGHRRSTVQGGSRRQRLGLEFPARVHRDGAFNAGRDREFKHSSGEGQIRLNIHSQLRRAASSPAVTAARIRGP